MYFSHVNFKEINRSESRYFAISHLCIHIIKNIAQGKLRVVQFFYGMPWSQITIPDAL